LPWLAPGTAALVALARCGSAEVWLRVRTDPGAVLLLAPCLSDESPDISSAVLATALRRLDAPAASFVDWSRPDVVPVYRAAIAFARLAESLARTTGACDPFRAWAAGLLAPLGWLAVAAVEPEAVNECLREPVYADDLPRVQRQLWRIDAHAIARRLARRWDLPDWLRFVVGDLALPADTAVSLGADDRLFRVAQLAVAQAQANGYHLGLPVGTSDDELLRSLGLSADDLRKILHRWRDDSVATPEQWTDPHAEPLLPDVLAAALELRRREEGPSGESLEREIDRLHGALLAQRTTEAERLHRLKLRAMAELAAGAGHEINNPLAVISGQSQ
jgi:signal transduction histidine kinase